MWLTVEEVMLLLGDVSRSKAYKVMKSLGNEIVAKGYAAPPAGKIQKDHFCEKFLLNKRECESILEQHKTELAEAKLSRKLAKDDRKTLQMRGA